MARVITLLLMLFALTAPQLVFQQQAGAVDLFTHTCDKYLADNGGDTSKLPVACQDVQTQNGSTKNPIIKIISAGISILSYIVGIAAIIGLIVSGIRLTIGGGDATKVSAAKTGITYSLVGVAVTVIAQVLVTFVLKRIS